MTRAVAALVLLAVGFGAAQELPAPKLLHVGSRTKLPVPGFHGWGHARCDDSGDVFFHIGSFKDAKILRLSADGEDHHLFEVPDFSEPHEFSNFRVSRDGQVYVLVATRDAWYLFQFSREGGDPTKTRLDMPATVKPLSFEILPKSMLLVAGYYTETAPEDLRGKSYVARFASSGRLLTDHMLKSSLVSNPKTLQNDVAAEDERGNTYLPAVGRILVISASGNIERSLKYKLPDAGYHITNLEVSGAYLAVWLQEAPAGGGLMTTRLEVLDRQTGDLAGFYEPDDELGNNALCFDGSGFIFSRVNNGFVNFLRANL